MEFNGIEVFEEDLESNKLFEVDTIMVFVDVSDFINLFDVLFDMVT